MEIQIPSSTPSFISECSSASDRELLLDMVSNRLEPSRVSELIDFIGRSYKALERNTRFQTSVKRFFQEVVWRRFQKVVWSDKGTVGIDVPIEMRHVKVFLQAIRVDAPNVSFMENVMRFLQQQAQGL